ncbi:Ig-like domain-containing protein [Corallococcus carmarthensis]|uniref:RCC1 domain-containing protein n=1 Tax=Corallococcus carmarthensis TaxID=2316728 RepID=UPI00148C8A76|nr:PKD domain-containing protein [Corallococcus carmarthensis]NOK22277.1 PKD domain-containing protein [Corallococcus carmarthensis]
MRNENQDRLALLALGMVLALAGCGVTQDLEPREGNASAIRTQTQASGLFNSWPQVAGVTALPSSVAVGQTTQVTAYASDADGDPLSYEWTASCAGTWADATSASPSFTPSMPRPPEGTCTLTVVVRDGRGGQATDSLVLSVSGPSCVPTTCEQAGHQCGPMSDGCGGNLECGTCSSGDPCNDTVCNLSTGTCESTPMPVACATLSLVSVGGAHSLALKSDGTVWAWGANHSYQLGFETYETTGHLYMAVPTMVPSLSGVTSLSAGGEYSVVLKQDGTVWAWGSNSTGQSGNGVGGGGTWISAPTLVPGITNVASIAAGWNHALALKQDGTVWAWGYNVEGEVGDGTSSGVSPPVRVLDLTSVRAVEAGNYHSVALKQDGTVWTWGFNDRGQLGDGTTTTRLRPVQVRSLTDVVAVSAGSNVTLALKQDGTVWAWGYNGTGELGDGTNTNRLLPVQVLGLTGVTAISDKQQTAIALKQDGTLWVWGWTYQGQHGNGTDIPRSVTVPVQVPGLSGVIAFSVSGHVLALKQDGTLWAFGANYWGGIGDGTLMDRNTPVQVQGLTQGSAIASGENFTVALKSDGTSWSWGNNSTGQLGDGTTMNRPTPVQVLEN